MNILILSWRGPGHPNFGGAEIASHEHAKAWVKKGQKVTLFTSFFPGAKRKEVIDGVEIIRDGGEVFDVHLRAFFWYLFGEHQKFDLVIDEIHGIPFFTPLYVRTKKLAYIHEVAKEVWKLNPWPKPFNLIPFIMGRLFEPLVFTYLYKGVDFMTVSNSTKKDLIEWGVHPDSVTVIHNGVNLIKVKTKKQKIKTVIYLGALAKDKGIEDAIRTFSLINDRDAEWQFWVVGKGDRKYNSYLKRLSSELGLKGKIKFWGYVDDRKKFILLAKSYVLVNPSVREGWGLVNIEANSVFTPVVAYNVSGVKDSVRNGVTGILVDKYKGPRGLAKQVFDLLENETRYKKIQANAVLWSKKFTWEDATRESCTLLARLIH